jgi:hypothetical protein
MDRQEYMAWLSAIDELSADQRAEAGRALAEQPSLEAVVCLLEERIGAERRCPHCRSGKGGYSRPSQRIAAVFLPGLRQDLQLPDRDAAGATAA